MLPVVASNLAPDLFVRALTRAWKRGVRVYDPDYAHVQDTEAWWKVRRDAVIAHAIQFRRHLVAGRDWFVEPGGPTDADAAAAELMQEVLGELSSFSSIRFNLAEAVFRGQAFGLIHGKRVNRDFGDSGRRDWWVPTQVEPLDKWFFRQEPIPGATHAKTRWMVWDFHRERYIPLTAEQRRRLIVHIYHDTQDALGYGRGLLEAIYYYWWAKTVALKEGLQGLERWAQGWIVGRVGSMREGSTTRSNEDVRDELTNVLEKMRSRHILVFGEDDELDVKETSGRGHEIVMDLVNYLDQGVTQLILTSVLPTGGGADVGSLARARQEAESTEALIQFDRELLSETLTRDLIGAIWRHNRANIVELGLGEARLPTIQLHTAAKPDPQVSVGVIAQALGAGIKLRKDEVYEQLGFTPPTEEDEIIEAPQEGMPPGAPGEGQPEGMSGLGLPIDDEDRALLGAHYKGDAGMGLLKMLIEEIRALRQEQRSAGPSQEMMYAAMLARNQNPPFTIKMNGDVELPEQPPPIVHVHVPEAVPAQYSVQPQVHIASVQAGEVRAGPVQAGKVTAGQVNAGPVRAGEVNVEAKVNVAPKITADVKLPPRAPRTVVIETKTKDHLGQPTRVEGRIE